MSLHTFLYSRDLPVKIFRHILFWIGTCLPFLVMTVTSMYSKYNTGGDISAFISYQLSKFPGLLVDIIYTYVIAYVVIPSFFTNRNVKLLVSRILLVTFMAFVIKALIWYENEHLYTIGRDRLWLSSWFLFTTFLNDGSMMRCALFLCCKMLKNYHLKSAEKIAIMKENATAELQLLKAQVHPHFLFNTLNNIYSFSLNKSPVAASLVLKLSDTLRYMVTDCEAPLVPLEKEVKMLNDYIGLESVRYGSRLDIQMKVSGDPADKFIAPLLLIPLIENSFKHGTSQVLDKPWIRLSMEITDNRLRFVLSNSKPSANKLIEGKKGIGLKNVSKRMQLLYPDKHKLSIKVTDDVYEVEVLVPLQVDKQQDADLKSVQLVPSLITTYDKR